MPRVSAIHAQVTKLINQLQCRLENQQGCSQTTLNQYAALDEDIKKLHELCYACMHNGILPASEATHIVSTTNSAEIESKVNYRKSASDQNRLQDSSGTEKRKFMREYGKAIFNINHSYINNEWVEVSTGYKPLDKLLTLIHTWYNKRLMTKYDWNRNKYLLAHISETIYAIVILFGYYQELAYRCDDMQILHKYIDDITEWSKNLQYKQYEAEHYMSPEIIRKCIDEPNPDYFTTTSLILWDLLLRYGFKNFCNQYTHYSDAPKTDGLDVLYERYAPDILDNYQGIDDGEYISNYGF